MIQQKYRYFGAFRLLLAVLVMVQHFGVNLGSPAMVAAIYPLAVGTIAVVVFFILSGFIIAEAAHYFYAKRPFSFLLNRVLRIIPPFLVAISISVGVHYYFLYQGYSLLSLEGETLTNAIFSPHELLKNYTSFLPAMRIMGALPAYSFLPYIWAVRVELLFYAAVFGAGVMAKYIKPISHSTAMALAGLGGLAVFGLFLIGKAPALFGFAPYFVFGATLFYILSGHKKAWALLLPAGVAMTWHFGQLSALDTQSHAFAPNMPAQFLIFGALTIATVILATLNSTRFQKLDRFWGELSYPLYLNHFIVGVVWKSLYPDPSDNLFFVACGTSFFFSIVMYYLVEPPLKKLRNVVRGQKL